MPLPGLARASPYFRLRAMGRLSFPELPPLFGPGVTFSSLFFVCFRLVILAPAAARAASSWSPSKYCYFES